MPHKCACKKKRRRKRGRGLVGDLKVGWKAGTAAFRQARQSRPRPIRTAIMSRIGRKQGSGRATFLPGVTWHKGSGMGFRGGGMSISGGGMRFSGGGIGMAFHGAGLRGKRLLPRVGSGRRTI
jgi:hypothetical protein